MSNLQNRIAQILSDGGAEPIVEVVEEEDAIESITDMLNQANLDLAAARSRVEDLQSKLARAKGQQDAE